MESTSETDFDVIVLGGGAAGLSAALTLARARRSVLVVDSGTPRNRPAEGVHGLLGREGIPPLELLERGRTEARGYGAEIVDGAVVDGERAVGGFMIRLAGGTTASARRLVVATGLIDELPAVDGIAERWGRDVIHCPYCHGWEVRDRRIVVVASAAAVHRALLFRQWSADITLLTPDSALLADEDHEKLAAREIAVVSGTASALVVDDDRLTGVRTSEGALIPADALAVSSRMTARLDGLAGLGLAAVEHPFGVGTHLVTDSTGRTDVPGIWAAGNVTDLMAQVGTSMAAATWAAAQLNADLIEEDTARAVQERRETSG